MEAPVLRARRRRRAGDPRPADRTPSARRRHRPRRRVRRTSHVPLTLDRRPRAPSGATRRGGLPHLSVQRPQARPVLACRRRRQCARPLALCPPFRAGLRHGRRRQMDRRRHRRPRRSARSHPAESAPGRCPRGRRRGPSNSSACRNRLPSLEATRRPRRPMAPDALRHDGYGP